ncbi:MAG: diaminopimelate epimerase [Alphaproteobacteria bacterium]|nr:diaminopimelate epimerase [Alphaproteobacteria bacterium]
MNGLGNEILVVDARGSRASPSANTVRAIAERPETRFDQLMALFDPKTPGTAAYVRIYNADGSEVGACGNGTRCVGWVLAEELARAQVSIETAAGVLAISVKDQSCISVDMGEPNFDWDKIPLAEEFRDTRAIELQIGPIDAPVLHSPSVVNIGNPHAIFWVDDTAAHDLGRFGPLLEHHPVFPEGANISLAKVTSREAVAVRTWERGAGLTKACGTAACAAAVTGARKRFLERTATVTVPGGNLVVEWTPKNRIIMSGPVELEGEGLVTL